MEESYIHISDGKRIWVNVGEDIHKLHIGDVLEMDVNRSGKDIEVVNINILETGPSHEYAIPDEDIEVFTQAM